MSTDQAEVLPDARGKRRRVPVPVGCHDAGDRHLLVWVAALFIPAGQYQTDRRLTDPGTFQQVPSPLTLRRDGPAAHPRPGQRDLRPAEPRERFVDTETVGRMFGQIGVIVFIMSIGAFISVSFATRSLEVAVAALANRLRSQGLAAHRRGDGAVLAARLHDGLLGGDTRVLRAVHPADGRARLRPAGHRVDDHPRAPRSA